MACPEAIVLLTAEVAATRAEVLASAGAAGARLIGCAFSPVSARILLRRSLSAATSAAPSWYGKTACRRIAAFAESVCRNAMNSLTLAAFGLRGLLTR